MEGRNASWLVATAAEAKSGGHIFPEMAACEAALESAHEGIFGGSALAREANNLFGMKQHQHPTYGTLNLPTREFLNSEWVVVEAVWVKYDRLSECFEDRMMTLRRLSSEYPHYAAALDATDARTYVTEVSKTWSTDPQRAAKVLAIYDEAFPCPASNAGTVQDASSGEN